MVFNWLSAITNRFSDRRTKALGRRTKALRPVQHVQAVARHNVYHWGNLTDMEAQSRVYRDSPWVYVAVNRIAEAAALTPLKVYRLDGEQRIEVERHPLEVLLDRPNPFISRFELLEQTIGMLELTGNAYWFLSGDGMGVPKQIWPLRPDRVSIVPDENSYVRGYVYEIDGKRIPLEAVEVIHFKRWHPSNDYYGLSALEAAQRVVTTDKAMAEWNRNTFGKDNGVPAGVVHIKEMVTDADFERIQREWRSSFGGTQRRTAFVRGKDTEWQSMGLNHNELDFLQGRKSNRDEILNIFGIPVGLVSDNATEANAKVAERVFIERTLWPKLVRISQKISQELLPFWPGQHVAEFEDIRPTDSQARLDEIRTAYSVLSINEIRQRYYRLQPVGWGELPVGMDGDNVVGAQRAVPLPNAETTPENPTKSALTELAQWEKYTLRRWGRKTKRSFEVHQLPDEVAFEVSAGLLAAESEDDAREVFVNARKALADGQMIPSDD